MECNNCKRPITINNIDYKFCPYCGNEIRNVVYVKICFNLHEYILAIPDNWDVNNIYDELIMFYPGLKRSSITKVSYGYEVR